MTTGRDGRYPKPESLARRKLRFPIIQEACLQHTAAPSQDCVPSFTPQNMPVQPGSQTCTCDPTRPGGRSSCSSPIQKGQPALICEEAEQSPAQYSVDRIGEQLLPLAQGSRIETRRKLASACVGQLLWCPAVHGSSIQQAWSQQPVYIWIKQ